MKIFRYVFVLIVFKVLYFFKYKDFNIFHTDTNHETSFKNNIFNQDFKNSFSFIPMQKDSKTMFIKNQT